MKIVKIEKNDCTQCNQVEAMLRRINARHESLNTDSTNVHEAEIANAYLITLDLFTVPVTILEDDDGEILEYVLGDDPPKIEALVRRMNS